MPKFNVPVTRDTTETVYIEVEADTVADAVDLAVADASAWNPGLDWRPDDNGSVSDPYFAGGADYSAVEFVGPLGACDLILKAGFEPRIRAGHPSLVRYSPCGRFAATFTNRTGDDYPADGDWALDVRAADPAGVDASDEADTDMQSDDEGASIIAAIGTAAARLAQLPLEARMPPSSAAEAPFSRPGETEAIAGAAAHFGLDGGGRTFAYTAETCPSKHWNGGDDICVDCGTNLN